MASHLFFEDKGTKTLSPSFESIVISLRSEPKAISVLEMSLTTIQSRFFRISFDFPWLGGRSSLRQSLLAFGLMILVFPIPVKYPD